MNLKNITLSKILLSIFLIGVFGLIISGEYRPLFYLGATKYFQDKKCELFQETPQHVNNKKLWCFWNSK